MTGKVRFTFINNCLVLFFLLCRCLLTWKELKEAIVRWHIKDLTLASKNKK